MFKIWLKSNEFEGIKNIPQRLMTFVNFWLELMMILMFLAGDDVLDDILDVLYMPNEFIGIKTPSKIDKIHRFWAGVDDDFDVPDLGWHSS